MRRSVKCLIWDLPVVLVFIVAFPRPLLAQPKVTFAYSSIGSMATGVWMAKEIGAFEKNGVQGDIIFISSGPVVVQALIGGDLQGGSGATNAVINAVLNGAPIVGVAATANRPYHGSSFSRKSTGSKISKARPSVSPASVRSPTT